MGYQSISFQWTRAAERPHMLHKYPVSGADQETLLHENHGIRFISFAGLSDDLDQLDWIGQKSKRS